MVHNIIVFTLEGCSHCVELKKELRKETLPFTEIEVTKNATLWNGVVEQTGHNTLPTVFISLNGGDEGPVFVPERDYKDRYELIKKIKEYVLKQGI